MGILSSRMLQPTQAEVVLGVVEGGSGESVGHRLRAKKRVDASPRRQIVDQVVIVNQVVKKVKAGISPQRAQRTQRLV
jgi:hypothetical protein